MLRISSLAKGGYGEVAPISGLRAQVVIVKAERENRRELEPQMNADIRRWEKK